MTDESKKSLKAALKRHKEALAELAGCCEAEAIDEGAEILREAVAELQATISVLNEGGMKTCNMGVVLKKYRHFKNWPVWKMSEFIAGVSIPRLIAIEEGSNPTKNETITLKRRMLITDDDISDIVNGSPVNEVMITLMSPAALRRREDKKAFERWGNNRTPAPAIKRHKLGG